MIGIVGYQKFFVTKFETSAVVSKARINSKLCIILQSNINETTETFLLTKRKQTYHKSIGGKR
jgi:hypothetical protein